MYLVTTSRKGISACQLAMVLGVSYKTTGFLGHRVRSLLVEEARLLKGIVELDETYIGDKPRRKQREKLLPSGKKPKRKKGRGVSKPCVFVAVERGGRFRAKEVSSHRSSHLGGAVRETVFTSAILRTDELPGYTRVGKSYVRHLRGEPFRR